MAQINVTLNENKSIKQYSNQAFDGSQLVTIDDADLASLGEYANLMWVDDNGLVHAENLPTTKYQQALNQIKSDIQNSQQQVNADIQTMQGKIDEANQASAKLDDQVKGFNNMIGQVQMTFAKQLMTINTAVAKVSANNNQAK